MRFPDFLATFSGNKSARLAAGLGDQLIRRLAGGLGDQLITSLSGGLGDQLIGRLAGGLGDQLIGRLAASRIMISPLSSPRIPGMI